MEKHLYVVVATVENIGGIWGDWNNFTLEVEATGRVDAELKFPDEAGLIGKTIYILTVYGPYERSNDVAK